MKLKLTILGLVILGLVIAIISVRGETPNDKLVWTASQSKEVTSYKIYEVVESKNVLIGESKTNSFEIPRKKGKHVYVVTAISPTRESDPCTPLKVENK